MELYTEPRSQPTLHVLTAEVPFVARFSVSVRGTVPPEVFPFQVKLWNPSNEVAVEVWYAASGTIKAGTRSQSTWHHVRDLLAYTADGTETWQITRGEKRVTVEVANSSGRAVFDADPEIFPDLFRQPSLSLTMYATATAAGGSRAVVRNPVLSVPRQTRYATTVQGPLYRLAVAIVAMGILLWLVALLRGDQALLTRISIRRPRIRPAFLVLLFVTVVGTLVVGWRLSHAPGHPYDMRSAAVWSQTARQHGVAAIAQYPLLATARDAHGGQPYAAVNYPYPPLLMYIFWLVGKVAPPERTEQGLKMIMMIVVVAGGIGLLGLLRHLRVAPALVAAAAGAYMLNPAVLFDSAVWGQTDAIVAIFLLMAGAGIVLKSAPLLWIGTMLAILTKQTGGLFAPMLLVLGAGSLGIPRMLRGLPAGILIVFLVLTPAFLAGVHPSSVYRPLVTKVVEFGSVSGQDPLTGLVSQGAFNLWAAVAGTEGARGWARLAFPDSVPTRLGASYFMLSRLAFGSLILIVLVLILKRRPAAPGTVLLALAVFGVGAAVLLTRMQARYLYFGLMFAAASLPWMPRKLGIPVLIVLTGTMLVAMWGVLVSVSIWHPGLLPAFEPERSWFNWAAAAALSADLGITVGGLLNVAALLALLWALWRAVHHATVA